VDWKRGEANNLSPHYIETTRNMKTKKTPEVPIETIIRQIQNRIIILKIRKLRMEKLYQDMIDNGNALLGQTITEDIESIKKQITDWEKETKEYEKLV
jgi:hypothetical protein